MEVRQAKGMAVTADFLECFAYMSDNEVFRTERFRKALIDFREYGCNTPNKVEFDVDRELEFIRDRLTHKKRLER